MAPHSSTLAWKNPMDPGAWWAAVHAVAKSRTRLSDFTFTSHFHGGLTPLSPPSELQEIPVAREKGRTWHTRARSRGPGLRRAGARAPLQQRTGEGSSGAGDHRRGGAEGVSRGSGLSSAALSQVLLDLSGPNGLCSPATLLLPRCAFVLNGRCRSGHHGGTRS